MIFLLWNRGSGQRTPVVTTSGTTQPYTHTTQAQAITSLSLRLADPAQTYWTHAEMGSRIIQSLRMWQALTGFYRERAAFTTVAGDGFMNLHTLPHMAFSVKDQDAVTGLQYSLLESPTGNSWSGGQFTLDGVTKALQRRRNQFLLDTGMVLSYSLLNVPAEPIGRAPLPDSTIDIRRVAWLNTSTGVYNPVFRDDEFSGQSFNPGWPQNPGVPQIYSAAITTPTYIQVIPAPRDKGQLEMVNTATGPDLNPATGVLLSVPDDLSWAVEFGALADLLSTDGLTRDPMRAKHCESLYQLAAETAKLNPSVLMTQINGEALYSGSVFELDTFMPDWENSPAKPSFSALAGRNLLVLGPTPDTAYGVTLDIVPNMPVPPDDGTYIQVGREHLEAILDLAQHLCSIKQGGQEFADTLPLFQNFLRVAGVQNHRLAANSFYLSVLNPASTQSKEVPRLKEPSTNA